MSDLKSYKTIQQISQSLYANLTSEEEILLQLKSYEEVIKSNLIADLESLFGNEIEATNTNFIFDNCNYRQGATAYILKGQLENEPEYKFLVECLIDHARIWVKLKNVPDSSKYNGITAKIKNAFDMEDKAELNKI